MEWIILASTPSRSSVRRPPLIINMFLRFYRRCLIPDANPGAVTTLVSFRMFLVNLVALYSQLRPLKLLANSHLTGLESFCLSESSHPLTSHIESLFPVYFEATTPEFPDLYKIMYTKWSKLLVVANAIVCGAASALQSPLLSYKSSCADQTSGRFLSLQYGSANWCTILEKDLNDGGSTSNNPHTAACTVSCFYLPTVTKTLLHIW